MLLLPHTWNREARSELVAEEPPPEVSRVYERGQTVVPKRIREALAIESGARLQWQVHEGVIRVIPVPANPVRALRGLLKGTGYTYARFLRERQLEREAERRREARELRTSSTPPR
jgi:bifunctional DNA-binding transcriptional regulator/antitoxin component of YhaV-PrlF toxin-antitoxin module